MRGWSAPCARSRIAEARSYIRRAARGSPAHAWGRARAPAECVPVLGNARVVRSLRSKPDRRGALVHPPRCPVITGKRFGKGERFEVTRNFRSMGAEAPQITGQSSPDRCLCFRVLFQRCQCFTQPDQDSRLRNGSATGRLIDTGEGGSECRNGCDILSLASLRVAKREILAHLR